MSNNGVLDSMCNILEEQRKDDNSHCPSDEDTRQNQKDSNWDNNTTIVDNNEEIGEWVDDGDEGEEERISLSLIGKIWSNRVLNPTTFMTTIKNVWVTQYGVDVSMIGQNMYQFQFCHWWDKEKVLKGQP